ncbi:protein of unknown function [uncultured Sphingopyxis sp.]|uniref:Uncharacterized protein n=1 Tax=uncultured Sphingopyxis sp. TaxID=310581 RepID=A0A1Y5Q2C6_9SPHN|nr:protein of unknown function [uncultured Sphingopyxis sp.]
MGYDHPLTALSVVKDWADGGAHSRRHGEGPLSGAGDEVSGRPRSGAMLTDRFHFGGIWHHPLGAKNRGRRSI